MEPTFWLSVAALVLAIAAMAFALLHRQVLQQLLGDRPASPVALARDIPRVPPAEGRRPNGLFVPPPMVGAYTLRDWLIREAQRDNVWSEVVAEFYRRAASVDWVADYFGPVISNPARMATLQHHFTAQLIIVTHTGVNGAMLDSLAERHQGVTNSAGTPITAQVFDAVIDTLAGVLRDSGVPDHTIGQLAVTCSVFRPVLVRA